MIRRIKSKLFGDKQAEQRFHLGEVVIQEGWRRESIGLSCYPMNIVLVGIKWVSKAWYDIKVTNAFVRVHENEALQRVGEWDEEEKLYYPRFREYGGEIYIFRGRDYTFHRFEDGHIEIFVNIPPYIDINKEVRIRILGYLTLSSCFGYFDKTVNYNLKIEPENWR